MMVANVRYVLLEQQLLSDGFGVLQWYVMLAATIGSILAAFYALVLHFLCGFALYRQSH